MPISPGVPALQYSLAGPTGGPPVLFINGLGGLKESWFHQIRALRGEFRLLSYNQRGMGQSQALDQPTTMEDFAADALGLLDLQRWRRATVVGISFGGRVAQQLALDHPGRVERLVLVGTSCGGAYYEPGDLHAYKALRRSWTLSAETWSQVLIPKLFGREYFDSHRPQLDRLAGWWARNPASRVALERQWEAWDGFDLWAELPSIEAPCLVVHGDEDRMSPLQNGRVLAARIPGARFELLERLGHSPNVEDPARFNALLMDFLRGS